ncbi:MAG: hypothetical protein IKO55_12965, partial [Kiritimatiellae bacterium]|nr:hypothetical protein [Kiritimatiellia bacterium]
AAPIVDHNIQLTETACEVRPWYRGETRVEPSAYMSILLDPCKNSAVNYLCAFADTVKAFAPGSFPGHCHAVRELEFTTKHLINTLATLTDAAVFAHSLRCLGAFFATISDPANTMLPKHDLVQRIDTRLEQLVDSFRDISREFGMHEREIVFRAIPRDTDATADELLAVAKETNAVVKRIDARDVKRGKRQAEIDKQEKCYAYWEMGRAKESVKSAAKNGKVTYANVFEYFRRELEAMGIKSAAKFTLAINRRAKRLSKSKK